jgi:hypothetical protein
MPFFNRNLLWGIAVFAIDTQKSAFCFIWMVNYEPIASHEIIKTDTA